MKFDRVITNIIVQRMVYYYPSKRKGSFKIKASAGVLGEFGGVNLRGLVTSMLAACDINKKRCVEN